jgi:photosystem II stability/assembly factor-like uncharacterized protein
MRFAPTLLIPGLILALSAGTWARNGLEASPTPAAQSKGADGPLHKPAPREEAKTAVVNMKLLAPGIGWVVANHWRLTVNDGSEVANGTGIYWTTDNGAHWREITPPITSKMDIADVFFLDTHRGWAIFEQSEDTLYRTPSDWQEKVQLALATTTDAGATWSKMPFTLMLKDYLPKDRLWTLNNAVRVSRIAFVDPLHGWLQLSYSMGLHGNNSLLLLTSNGGRTWREASAYPGPNSSDMLLLTPNEGWVFGSVSPDGSPCLFVTRDGAKSWQELSADPPTLPLGKLESADCDVYGLPVFENPTHGYLREGCTDAPVYSMHTTVLFATNDDGRTWKLDRMIKNVDGQCNSSAITDSVWVAPVMSNGHVTLLHVGAGATIDAGRNNASISGNSMCDTGLSLVTPTQGWMSDDSGELRSTTDGGQTWTTITPGRNRK